MQSTVLVVGKFFSSTLDLISEWIAVRECRNGSFAQDGVNYHRNFVVVSGGHQHQLVSNYVHGRTLLYKMSDFVDASAFTLPLEPTPFISSST